MTTDDKARIIQRAELLDESCGVGLWSAHIHHGDAAHPDSEWTWSPEFRRLLGFTDDFSFPNKMTSWADRLHPDDTAATFAAFAAHLQDQTDRSRYQMRYRLRMRDDSYRWFSATGGCKHMPDGTIWACGSLSDIHDAVLLQEESERAAQQDSEAIALLSDFLAKQAEGDLSRQIDTPLPDKMAGLRNSFNSMGLRLSELINEVKGTAHSMLDEAGAISEGAHELQRRAQSQAASIEQTAAALEEISGNISMTSENAKHADMAAIAAKEKTDRGEKIVESVIAVMEQIEQHTKEISKITGIIETFAFQTNLLSINAAVEAARAGEVGRGFAVVATEVRNLAQQSSNASKNINELISKSASDVARGVDLVREAGEALGDIGGAVSAMASSVADIANASSEQSIGVGEISSAISQIDSATQSNLNLSESNTASAQSLQQNLSGLVERVSIFRTAGSARMAPVGGAETDDDWARELGATRRHG